MKTILRRILISFAVSAFSGLFVNLMIDAIVNGAVNNPNFISMPPDFVALFPTPAMAAYINVILYGCIGAAFAGMTFVFELDRIGYIIQNIIYFVGTSVVLVVITFVIWQLYRYPVALYCTLSGYAVSFIIMGVVRYRTLKQDVEEINRYVK